MKTARRDGPSRVKLFLLIVAVIVAAIMVIPPARESILWWLGNLLVESDPPQKADAIEVLGGDILGRRILLAAKLASDGIAPKVLVTGVAGIYGRWECDLEIDYAATKGYSRDLFVPVHSAALSTEEEVTTALLPEVRRRGIHRLLVVTSEFHTKRALRIIRKDAPDLDVRIAASDTPHWRQGRWWTDREGRKIWLLEMTKTITQPFGF